MKICKKTIHIKILVSFIVITLVGCSNKNEITILEGPAFGTSYRIEYYSKTKSKNIEKGIDSIINSINNSLSTYINKSDISKINNGDQTIITNEQFRDVFNLSKEIFYKSDGYFDPTVGSLRNAYGFGDIQPLKKITNSKIDSILEFVGFNKVKLLSNGKIFKDDPRVYLDFNSIAKGYAVDRIVLFLKNSGSENLRVEIGGEIRTSGRNLRYNLDWTILLESANSKIDNREFLARIKLVDQAIAGSGNFRKFRIDSVTNRKYVHTINPLSGQAEQSDILNSYVIADNCAIADGYATTFMAMGIEKSKKLISNLENIDVFLVYSDSIGETKYYITPGFKNSIVE